MEPKLKNGSNNRSCVACLLWWSRLLNASSKIKVCVRRPAVNSVKRGRIFVIQTLDKVDSAVRMTVLSGAAFLRINGFNIICINVSIFFTYSLENWLVNTNATFEVW